MKKIVLFLASLFLVVGIAPFGEAQVSVNIDVAPPPPLEFQAPPDVVVVPSGASDVYLVPNTVGLYFYGGHWYRHHHDHWFRASLYNGPWVVINDPLVPRVVAAIPPDYILGLPPGYHRIHYGDFHRHWRDWGRNHHWNNQNWYRDHSKHHWGGRDFHHRPPPPPPRHGRDVHRKPDVHRDRDVHNKPGVHRAGDVHKASARGHQGGEHHEQR